MTESEAIVSPSGPSAPMGLSLSVVETEGAEDQDPVVELVPQDVEDMIVVASTPGQLEQSQDKLQEWALRKVAFIEKQLELAEKNLKAAKDAKIATAPWRTEVKRWKKQAVYYTKLKEALDAGYFIVPDFPINVIAVRTNKKKPSDAGKVHHYISSVVDEKPQALTTGDGEYVNPNPSAWKSAVDVERTRHNGEKYPAKEDRWTTCHTFNQIDFPLRLVRPQVLKDFSRAMKRKIFDEIGVLPNTRRSSDPMIIGRLRMGSGRTDKTISFLISWWIPTQTL